MRYRGEAAVADRVSGGGGLGGRDPVLVQLHQVVGGGDQTPFRSDRSAASSSELSEAAVVFDLSEGRPIDCARR
jgi:hypothetical protein